MAVRGQRTRKSLRRHKDVSGPSGLGLRKTVWRSADFYPFNRAEHAKQVHARIQPKRRLRKRRAEDWVKAWYESPKYGR